MTENNLPQSPMDMILCEDNCENVVLYNEKNEPVEFQQVAVIPLDEKVYVILKPVVCMAGMDEDEALVFSIEEIENEECIVIVQEDDVVDAVFEEYYRLLVENGINVD